MDSKVSEKDMREVYFQAFGKEYDSADRKQAPLPIEIAYLVALQKLEREGKYAGGGEITDDNYYQSVNHFVYFCLNYPNNFYDAFDSHLKNHLSNKFKDYYNNYGTFGVMMKFYAELDAENRTLFTNWILKNYKGSPISSDISEKEYHNIVNHFFYFAMNYPSNFLDAFSSHLKPYLSEKWTSAYQKKGTMGAMVQFWSELDAENRKDFCIWIKKNYTGTPLYEMGGGLGDVVGMLPSPLPMSTIQPMAKGGGVSADKFINQVKSMHENIEEVILKDGTHIAGKDLMAKGGSVDDFDSTGTSMVIYHEKEGNFMIPKGQIYLYLYDVEGSGKKIQSGEFDWVFYPFASLSMIGQKGFIPPLKRIWTKKFQKEHKGSEHLLGVIKAFLIDKENGEKELYIDMMSVNPTKKKKGIMSFMIKDLRDNFKLSQNQVTFSQLTKEGEKFVEKGKYSDGGKIDNFSKDEILIINQVLRNYLSDAESNLSYYSNGASRYFNEQVRGSLPAYIESAKKKISEIEDDIKYFNEHKELPYGYLDTEHQSKLFLTNLNELPKTNNGREIFNNEIYGDEYYEVYLKLYDRLDSYIDDKFDIKYSDGGDVDDTKFKEGVKVETTVFMSTEDIGGEEDIEAGTIGTVLSEPNDEEDLVLVEIKGVRHYLPQDVLEVVSEFDNNNDDCINSILTSVNKIKPIADFGISDKKLIIIVKEQLTIDEIELLNNNLKNIKGCSEITDDEFTISYKENNKTLILNLKTDDFSIQKFKDGGKVLASSSSKDGINKLIEQYLYGSTITLVETDNDKIYEVHNKKGKTSFYVEFSRGKYKFIEPTTFADGGGVNVGYNVFNYTDNIYATDEVFKTKALANKFIKEFRNRFANQGYYRDNRMNKINIQDIDLLAIPSDFNPLKKYADGGGVKTDYFIAINNRRFDPYRSYYRVESSDVFNGKQVYYDNDGEAYTIDEGNYSDFKSGDMAIFGDALESVIPVYFNEKDKDADDRFYINNTHKHVKLIPNFNKYYGEWHKDKSDAEKELKSLENKFSDGGGVDVDLEDDFKKALVTSNFTYYTNNSDGIRMFRNSDNEELTGGVFAENSLTEDIENNDVVWASEDMKYNIDAMREKYSLGGILLSVGAGAFAYKLYLDYKKEKDKKRLEDFIKDEAKYYSKKIKSKINIDDDFQEDEERASRRMERDSDDMFQERE